MLETVVLMAVLGCEARGWEYVGRGVCLDSSDTEFMNYELVDVPSLAECQRQCVDAPYLWDGCQSVTYYPSTLKCRLNVDFGEVLILQPVVVPTLHFSYHPVSGVSPSREAMCYRLLCATKTPTPVMSTTTTEVLPPSRSPTAFVPETAPRAHDTVPTTTETPEGVRRVTQTVVPLPVTVTIPQEEHRRPESKAPSSPTIDNKDREETPRPHTTTMVKPVPPDGGSRTVTMVETFSVVKIPESVVATQGSIAKAASVAIVLSGVVSGAGSAAPNLGKLALLMRLNCDIEPVKLRPSWELHPTGVAVADSYELGILLCSPLIVLAVGMGCIAISGLGTTCTRKSFSEVLEILRFPGILYVPVMLVIFGIIYACTDILFNGKERREWVIIIAVVYLMCVVSLPVIVWKRVLRSRSFKAGITNELRAEGGSLRARVYAFLYGKKMWVPLQRGFIMKYGILFETTRDGMQWWPVFEYFTIFIVGVLSSVEVGPGTSCSARNYSLVGALLLHVLLTVRYKPYSGKAENIIAVIVSCLMCSSVLFMAIGIDGGYTDMSFPYIMAGYLFIAATFMMIVKFVYDIVAYVVTCHLGYRTPLYGETSDIDPLENTWQSSKEMEPLPATTTLTTLTLPYRPPSFSAITLTPMSCSSRHLTPRANDDQTPSSQSQNSPILGSVLVSPRAASIILMPPRPVAVSDVLL